MLLRFNTAAAFFAVAVKDSTDKFFINLSFCSTWNFCSQRCVHSAFICVLIVIWYNIYRYIAVHKLDKFSNTIYK